jgi:hypothetical protein
MKTILFLQDEAAPPRKLLHEVVQTKVSFRETEAVAGCNCDRWGHPYPGCVERVAEPKAELPIPVSEDK